MRGLLVRKPVFMAGGRRRYCLPFAVWTIMGVARASIGSLARQSSAPMNARPVAVTMGARAEAGVAVPTAHRPLPAELAGDGINVVHKSPPTLPARKPSRDREGTVYKNSENALTMGTLGGGEPRRPPDRFRGSSMQRGRICRNSQFAPEPRLLSLPSLARRTFHLSLYFTQFFLYFFSKLDF